MEFAWFHAIEFMINTVTFFSGWEPHKKSVAHDIIHKKSVTHDIIAVIDAEEQFPMHSYFNLFLIYM